MSTPKGRQLYAITVEFQHCQPDDIESITTEYVGDSPSSIFDQFVEEHQELITRQRVTAVSLRRSTRR